MVWYGRQGFGQLRFGRREVRQRIGHKEQNALDYVRSRRSNEGVDIVGVGGERTIKKAARSCYSVRGETLIETSQALKIEVHRVGVRSLFRASRLGGGKLG